MGDKPSTVDCTLFGSLLNSLVYKDVAPDFVDYLVSKKNLVNYTRLATREWFPEIADQAEQEGYFN